jgi:hypothetical protein
METSHVTQKFIGRSRYICRVLLKTLCIQLKLNVCSRLSQCNNWIGKRMPKLTKANLEGMFGRSKEQRRRMEKLNIEVVKLEMPKYSKFIQPWTRCFGILVCVNMGGFQGMRQWVFSWPTSTTPPPRTIHLVMCRTLSRNGVIEYCVFCEIQRRILVL